MLALAVLALIACLSIANGIRSVDGYHLARLGSFPVTERTANVDDAGKLKQVCIVIAAALDNANTRRDQDCNDLAELMRKALKLYLAFSSAACIVLLLGWWAARCVQKGKQPKKRCARRRAPTPA